jgi:hypothetical protein
MTLEHQRILPAVTNASISRRCEGDLGGDTFTLSVGLVMASSQLGEPIEQVELLEFMACAESLCPT